jgi:3-deoxy-D-arabino-heptulosonate 7-phosphate (DAHP) synthase class II
MKVCTAVKPISPFNLNTDIGSLRAKRLLQGIFDSRHEHGTNVALAYPLVVTGLHIDLTDNESVTDCCGGSRANSFTQGIFIDRQ